MLEIWIETISLALVPEVWFSPSPFLTSVPVLFSISLVKGPWVLIIPGGGCSVVPYCLSVSLCLEA
jgi:hypothetical protein